MTSRDEDRSHPLNVTLEVEEAETLIWALLDEHLEEAGLARLAELLEVNAAVRSRYVECVQLHVDLQDHFEHKTQEEQRRTGETPIVANALQGLAGLPGFLPTIP